MARGRPKKLKAKNLTVPPIPKVKVVKKAKAKPKAPKPSHIVYYKANRVDSVMSQFPIYDATEVKYLNDFSVVKDGHTAIIIPGEVREIVKV